MPAVWHKELLWAMSEGIHVHGSASMGALRAAELAPFGMRGVGATFEAFLHGDLEDDDEVAVMHAPEEAGYRPLSEAMVNIRALAMLRGMREELAQNPGPKRVAYWFSRTDAWEEARRCAEQERVGLSAARPS